MDISATPPSAGIGSSNHNCMRVSVIIGSTSHLLLLTCTYTDFMLYPSVSAPSYRVSPRQVMVPLVSPLNLACSDNSHTEGTGSGLSSVYSISTSPAMLFDTSSSPTCLSSYD